MSDKDSLKHELKTAATVALTLGATTLGAGEASAAEMDYDAQAKTEMYTPSAGYMEDPSAIPYEQCQDPSYYRTASDYARDHGLIRDARLSRGLSCGNGEWSGYEGAYINTHAKPDASDRVVFLPRDMQLDAAYIRKCRVIDAKIWQERGSEAYFHEPNSMGYGHHNGAGYGHGGSRVGEGLRRVDEAVHGIGQVVDGINHMINAGRGGPGGRGR